jgi:hypothetical protein
MEPLLVAAVSAAVGGLTSAFISVWVVTRNIKYKSVIEERQKWRDSLRDLIPNLVSQVDRSSRERVRDSIVLRMNPYKNGTAIRLMDRFVSDPSRNTGLAVVVHFQDMLKRDWEKAKIEGSFWPYRATERADRIVEKQKRQSAGRNEMPIDYDS